jgi:hypothetical protein
MEWYDLILLFTRPYVPVLFDTGTLLATEIYRLFSLLLFTYVNICSHRYLNLSLNICPSPNPAANQAHLFLPQPACHSPQAPESHIPQWLLLPGFSSSLNIMETLHSYNHSFLHEQTLYKQPSVKEPRLLGGMWSPPLQNVEVPYIQCSQKLNKQHRTSIYRI